MEGWNHNMAGKDNDTREPMLDMFLFETSQLLEQLEGMLIQIEREQSIPPESINEIFRIMHTIKGSSAMMSFDAISVLAHSLEDLFDTIRSGSGITPDCVQLTDIVLQAADFIRGDRQSRSRRGDGRRFRSIGIDDSDIQQGTQRSS